MAKKRKSTSERQKRTGQTSEGLKLDKKRPAKPVGWRWKTDAAKRRGINPMSKVPKSRIRDLAYSGLIYFENRSNRSDKKKRKPLL
jgi:hypothetical protein